MFLIDGELTKMILKLMGTFPYLVYDGLFHNLPTSIWLILLLSFSLSKIYTIFKKRVYTI